MTVSAIQRRPDGTIQALDADGWYVLRDGDSCDMGGGIVVSVLGPSGIGGGSIKACAGAVIAALVGLAIAGASGWGKGIGS